MSECLPEILLADATALIGYLFLVGIAAAIIVAMRSSKTHTPTPAPAPEEESTPPDEDDPKEIEAFVEEHLVQTYEKFDNVREYWESEGFQASLAHLRDRNWPDDRLRELSIQAHRKISTVALSLLVERHGLEVEDEVLSLLINKDLWTHYIILFQLEALHPPEEDWTPRLLVQLDVSYANEPWLWMLRELLVQRRQRGESALEDETFSIWFNSLTGFQQSLLRNLIASLGAATTKPWMEALQRYDARASEEGSPPQELDSTADPGLSEEQSLLQCGRQWTKHDRSQLAGAEEYAPTSEATRRIVEYLEQSPPRPVIVVGRPRTGKSTLVRSVVQELLERDWKIFEATPMAINAGMSYLGQLEARVVQLVKHFDVGRKSVWVAPDFAASLTVGATSINPTRGLASLLREALQGRRLVILGECSREEWAHACMSAPWLKECFEVVEAPVPDAETTMCLVESWYEKHPEILVTGELIDQAWQLIRQYQQEGQRPGNLFDLMRRASEDAQRRGENPPAPTREDLHNSLSRTTGLPLELLDARQALDPAELEALFRERIRGQDEAIGCLVDRVAMMKAGVTDPTRPLGVFLFAGPTGTGKTELAKTLADWLFGSESRLIRLDMSEFQDPSSLDTLLGTSQDLAPGTGQNFVDQVRRQPYSVVLLDEFEKASPRIWDLFLQVFDDGRLSDRLGRTVDFRHCMIILTTNLGSRIESTGALGFTARAMGFRPEKVTEALKQNFRPEFLNRLDRVVVFRPLTREVMGAILRKQIQLAVRRRGLRDRPWAVEWDDAAMEFLIDRGFSEELGARPMQRALERYVLTPLARAMVSQETPEGDHFLFVRVRGDELAIDFVDPDEAIAESPVSSETPQRASTTVREVALHPRGTRIELGLLNEELIRLENSISLEHWMEAREAELGMTSQADFWERPERFEVLELFASRERVERALEAARSLLNRMDSAGGDSVPRKPIQRLALRLHLLDAAVRDIEARNPGEALIVVQARQSELSTDRMRRFGEQLASMYRGWCERRGARLRERPELIKNESVFWVASIQSFGVWDLLHQETGLHVWEYHDPDSPRLSKHDTLLVQALSVSASSDDSEIRSLVRKIAAKPDLEATRQVVRRYRKEPSPLVRDAARAWRTGRLEWVMAGDFDLIGDEAPILTEDQLGG